MFPFFRNSVEIVLYYCCNKKWEVNYVFKLLGIRLQILPRAIFPQQPLPTGQSVLAPPPPSPCIPPPNPNLLDYAAPPPPPPSGYHQFAYQQYAQPPPPPPPVSALLFCCLNL